MADATPTFAIASIGEPEHVDSARERCFDLGLQNLSIEIVSKFEAEFAGGLGDADAYVHVGPFDEGHTIVETDRAEKELSTDVLIRGDCVIDAISNSNEDRSMPRRSVVIVAFDRLQPLDAVGPHEVFAGATAVLAAEQRTRPGKDIAGYDISIVSKDGTAHHDRERYCRS